MVAKHRLQVAYRTPSTMPGTWPMLSAQLSALTLLFWKEQAVQGNYDRLVSSEHSNGLK